MTPDEIKKLKELAEKATPGPWKPMQNPERKVIYILTPKGILDHDVQYENQKTDAEFIAAARKAVPELIAEVEFLEKDRAQYISGEKFQSDRADRFNKQISEMGTKLAQAVEVLKIIAFGKEAGPYSAMHRIRKARALLKEWGVE